MSSNSNSESLPPIQHQVTDPILTNFLELPQAKFIETQQIGGMCQLQAQLVRPVFNKSTGDFEKWEGGDYFQFQLTFSPNKSVIRLELYDTLLFPILVEQIIKHGYTLKNTGEDVEFATIKTQQSGWLGWAHFLKNE